MLVPCQSNARASAGSGGEREASSQPASLHGAVMVSSRAEDSPVPCAGHADCRGSDSWARSSLRAARLLPCSAPAARSRASRSWTCRCSCETHAVCQPSSSIAPPATQRRPSSVSSHQSRAVSPCARVSVASRCNPSLTSALVRAPNPSASMSSNILRVRILRSAWPWNTSKLGSRGARLATAARAPGLLVGAPAGLSGCT